MGRSGDSGPKHCGGGGDSEGDEGAEGAGAHGAHAGSDAGAARVQAGAEADKGADRELIGERLFGARGGQPVAL